MKRLFWWALGMVVLEAAVYTGTYAVSDHKTATDVAGVVTGIGVFLGVVFGSFRPPISFGAFAANAVALFAVVAVVSSVNELTFTALGLIIVVLVIISRRNLSAWRTLVVLLSEAGAITGWMLFLSQGPVLAALTLVAGLGLMAVAAFAGVSEADRPKAPQVA